MASEGSSKANIDDPIRGNCAVIGSVRKRHLVPNLRESAAEGRRYLLIAWECEGQFPAIDRCATPIDDTEIRLKTSAELGCGVFDKTTSRRGTIVHNDLDAHRIANHTNTGIGIRHCVQGIGSREYIIPGHAIGSRSGCALVGYGISLKREVDSGDRAGANRNGRIGLDGRRSTNCDPLLGLVMFTMGYGLRPSGVMAIRSVTSVA